MTDVSEAEVGRILEALAVIVHRPAVARLDPGAVLAVVREEAPNPEGLDARTFQREVVVAASYLMAKAKEVR